MEVRLDDLSDGKVIASKQLFYAASVVNSPNVERIDA